MKDWLIGMWNKLTDTLQAQGANLMKLVLVLLLGLVVVRIVLHIFRKIMNKTKLRGAAGDFLSSLLKSALLIVYVIILLALLGVDTTSLVAIFTALSLAISLAVQGTISNVASGIMLISSKPFEEGDFVEIGGTSGTVETITISCTKLTTPDNKVVVIPNSTVTAENITNYSTKETRRLDLTLSVAYGSDVERVKTIVRSVIEKHDNILREPAPLVRLSAHGESSLDFVVRVWVKQADYWPVNFDLKEELLAAMVENGIEIPFNQLDVHVVNH